MRFIKVKFEELNDRQKIMVMREMIDRFARAKDYVDKKADAEWIFEVVDLSEDPSYVIHQDKAVAFNKADQEERSHRWAAKL